MLAGNVFTALIMAHYDWPTIVTDNEITNLETRSDGRRFLCSNMNPKHGWFVEGEAEPLLDGRIFLRSATHPDWGFIVKEELINGTWQYLILKVVKNPRDLRLVYLS